MDKRDYFIVFLSQFDLTSSKMAQIIESMKEPSIECFKKTKFNDDVLKQENYKKMLESADPILVETYVKNLNDRDIGIVTIFSDNYPEKLKKMSDNPYILYYKGDISLANALSLSVVGSRKPTSYGKMVTERIVRDVASGGVVIISGLAYGVDSIAHRVALENKGKTIAVLGGGFEHVYPSEHQALADEIAVKGLLLSEQRPKRMSSKYLFPLRNRIIAALGNGTLITEASIKSGTIHTKDFALEYGRDIYAVPGNIDSKTSELTNEVIKTGQAQCVTCGKDILDNYDIKQQAQQKSLFDLSADEQKIVKLLKNGIQSVDYLTKNAGLDINIFNSCLTMLEIRGIITRLAGGNVALN